MANTLFILSLSLLFSISTFADELPRPNPIHPKMTGYQIKNDDFTFQYYIGTVSETEEVNQAIVNFQNEIAKQKELSNEVTTAISWVNAPRPDRFPNTEELKEPNEFDAEFVAHKTAQSIPDASVDRVDIVGEHNHTLWGRFKNWVSPQKASIQIAVMTATFKGTRIGVNTFKQYNSFVASHIPDPVLTEQSLWVFLWCSISAGYSRQINNYITRNVLTSNDEKAKLYSFVPHTNEEKSLWIGLKNLHNSLTLPSKYFRFFITEAIFVAAITSGSALINILNHMGGTTSASGLFMFTASAISAITLSTVTQGSSELANERFRTWAKLKGLSAFSSEFFSSAGFAVSSVLSVTGALFITAQNWQAGLGYLATLGAVSLGAQVVFNKKIDVLEANQLMNSSKCESYLHESEAPLTLPKQINEKSTHGLLTFPLTRTLQLA